MIETELLNIHLLRCSDNGLAYLLLLEIGVQRSPADGLQQHEAHAAACDLLVQRHQLEEPLGAERGPGDRQAGPAQQRAHAMNIRWGNQASASRQLRGHHHSRGDRLAVQPRAVPGARFDGVAEGMAEIEQAAHAGFALVGGDHARLQLATAPHRVDEGTALPGEQRVDAFFEPFHKPKVQCPSMFLPWTWLMAVLPPTEESTCARSVVGTCSKATPRW